ncbi:MAG: ADOP family duplicated permease [Gemmatimonadaceae bacterium]
MFADLKYRVRVLFNRSTLEQELDDELRFHIEQETEKHIRNGMSAAEARRRALVAFGGMERIKDDVRDVRGLVWLDVARQDLRYALRGIRSAPGFTTAVVLTLGLGIGVNVAMFGIIDRLMVRPTTYLRDPTQVNRVYLNQMTRGKVRQIDGYEYTRYLDLERWTKSFDAFAPFANRTMAVGRGEEARERNVAAVGGRFFELFDARPALGRFILPAEDRTPRGADVAVLSHAFWETSYGSRPDVLGEQIHIGPSTFTIIGVAPKGFSGIVDEESPVAFIPITTHAAIERASNPSSYYTNYNWGWLEILVRRKPGVNVEAASADLTEAYRRSWDAERAMSRGMVAKEIALPRAIAGPVQVMRGPRAGKGAKVLTWISGVAVIVLIITCANVANLLLARALGRRREIAVRLALGASRGRLMAQLLAESLLLALLGGVAGLMLAVWGSALLRTALLPMGELPVAGFGDLRTLGFAGLMALVTGLLTGLAPLAHAGREDLVTSLKTGVREGSHRSSKTRNALLVFQGALSVVLLVCAGLFVRSLQNVRQMRLGFDVEPVLHISGNARGTPLKAVERASLFRRLEAEARAIPGVENAARSLTVPFRDTWSQGLFVPGIDSVRKLGSFTLQGGSPEFFRTAGTRIIRGRGITDEDRVGAERVAVVSEAMASTLWPRQNAIGQCMKMNADTTPCITVVGVAENMRQNSLIEDAQLHYYLPIEQFNPQEASLYVRTRGPAAQQAEAIRRRLQTLMPGSSYLNATPMSEIVGSRQRSWRMGATMFGAFGALALVLAALGLYSVIAYEVTQRRHEMGVRVALGADRTDIMRLVFGQALSFVVAGLVIGGAIALIAARWLGGLLFQVSPRDPFVYGVVGLLLLLVAVVASALPALRAARVNPIIALRFE